jgi:hypothetical protein
MAAERVECLVVVVVGVEREIAELVHQFVCSCVVGPLSAASPEGIALQRSL